MLLLNQTFLALALVRRKMSKNEMMERVRNFALKHGMSIKEYRKIVMDFKAKSNVTGDELDPKNVFKIVKDKIAIRGKLFS